MPLSPHSQTPHMQTPTQNTQVTFKNQNKPHSHMQVSWWLNLRPYAIASIEMRQYTSYTQTWKGPRMWWKKLVNNNNNNNHSLIHLRITMKSPYTFCNLPSLWLLLYYYSSTCKHIL